jgi:hypothetical protein
MSKLVDIVRTEEPSSSLQLCRSAYGEAGIRDFLRDVVAIANAPVDGHRYIVVGAALDERGMRRFEDIGDAEFAANDDVRALVKNYIEPSLRIRYERVQVDGKSVGVYEIGDCQDRPYMMRADYSETLRRGDAYVRAKGKAIKMGRRQLEALFEQKFRASAASDILEVGFPGEIIHKERMIDVVSLEGLPSQVAIAKLEELLRIKTETDTQGSTNVLARLTHARLFGPDDPYEDRTREQLVKEMREVKKQYKDQDTHFLFEQNARQLQLVVFNQGADDIVDATVAVILPKQKDFYVASELPPAVSRGNYVAPPEAAQESYPTVKSSSNAYQVSWKIGDISAGEQLEAFATPLRICAGPSLAGKRFALQYSVFGQNLSTPARGRLKLVFNKP